MARFHGIIGYSELEETSPGIWSEKIVERTYTGDMTKNFVNADSSPRINPNVKLSNTISIYSDPYANSNLFNIRYLKYHKDIKNNASHNHARQPRNKERQRTGGNHATTNRVTFGKR